MRQTDNFRRHARACRELARQMPKEHRQQLLDMARQWDQLADDRERTLTKEPQL